MYFQKKKSLRVMGIACVLGTLGFTLGSISEPTQSVQAEPMSKFFHQEEAKMNTYNKKHTLKYFPKNMQHTWWKGKRKAVAFKGRDLVYYLDEDGKPEHQSEHHVYILKFKHKGATWYNIQIHNQIAGSGPSYRVIKHHGKTTLESAHGAYVGHDGYYYLTAQK